MKTANEIRNAIENIKYYSQRIETLAKQQFEADASLNDINAQVGSIRFDALGTIRASCSWLNTYCDNISSNLKTAEEQDRLLQSDKEEC